MSQTLAIPSDDINQAKTEIVQYMRTNPITEIETSTLITSASCTVSNSPYDRFSACCNNNGCSYTNRSDVNSLIDLKTEIERNYKTRIQNDKLIIDGNKIQVCQIENEFYSTFSIDALDSWIQSKISQYPTSQLRCGSATTNVVYSTEDTALNGSFTSSDIVFAGNDTNALTNIASRVQNVNSDGSFTRTTNVFKLKGNAP